MKVKINDKSSGAMKVEVRRPKAIWAMRGDEIIKALDLKNKIIDWHYSTESEYKNVSDIYSDDLVEYVSELIYEYCQEPQYEDYCEGLARRIISNLEEELVDEIYARDEEARDFEEARNEGMRGDY